MSRTATVTELEDLLALFRAGERARLLPRGEAHRVRLALGRLPSDEACWTIVRARRPAFARRTPLLERALRLEQRLCPDSLFLTPDDLHAVCEVLDDSLKVTPPGYSEAATDFLCKEPSYPRARFALYQLIGVLLEDGGMRAWRIAQRAAELGDELVETLGRRSPIRHAGAA